MKVKELIEELSKFDPETVVLGMCTDPTDYTYKTPFESIELGDPYDTNGYSGVDDEELDYSKCYEENEETGDETYVGPKVVLLNLGVV
jgi:hypothetical protein